MVAMHRGFVRKRGDFRRVFEQIDAQVTLTRANSVKLMISDILF
jgi:hypothetical protein